MFGIFISLQRASYHVKFVLNEFYVFFLVNVAYICLILGPSPPKIQEGKVRI